MEKIRIVFLAANPHDTSPLKLDEEVRGITEKIRASEYRDSLELITVWAVRPDDLLQVLNQHKPHIIHFSGHGSSAGEIMLLDNSGHAKPISTQAIGTLFATMKDEVRVVVLNSCFSDAQASAIIKIIDCAVGMKDEIGDYSAIIFAASFYRAIGFGRSVQAAFDQGRTALLLEGLAEENTPQLLLKEGIDAAQLNLIDNANSTGEGLPPSIAHPITSPSVSGIDLHLNQPSGQLVDACRFALTELLARQYPWGEWSDERTNLESFIAERQTFRGPEGPKPNVARTIFAVEALDGFQFAAMEGRKQLAVHWMTQDIADGWYLEYSSSQSLDSESGLPTLVKRRDIRHTAQVASALCRWARRRDPLAALLHSIVVSILPTGFWPDTPESPVPRLLASVYATEALGYVLAGRFRLAFDDLVDNSSSAHLAVRRSLAALHNEADKGMGLLGQSFTKPTPYLTGIALFRLAPLGNANQEFHGLIEKLIQGITAAAENDGWFDHSVAAEYRTHTRKRTTLRIAAGIALASQAGFPIPSEIVALCLELTQEFMHELEGSKLDSPDYACALICLAPSMQNGIHHLDLESIELAARGKRATLSLDWLKEFQEHASRVSVGIKLSLLGHEEMGRVFEDKIGQLHRLLTTDEK